MPGIEDIVRLADYQGLRDPKSNATDLITEDGIALEFAEQNADKLRYCVDRRAWLEWTGTVWKVDRLRKAFQYARALARKAAREAPGRLSATPSKVGGQRRAVRTDGPSIGFHLRRLGSRSVPTWNTGRDG